MSEGFGDLLAASILSGLEPNPDIPKRSSLPPKPRAEAASGATEQATSSESATGSNSSSLVVEPEVDWKEEYEKNVQHWRAESAVARKQAEENRARWEKVREEERKEGKGKEYEWDKVSAASAIVEGRGLEDPSPADVRDLVTGESQKGAGAKTLESAFPPITQPNPPYPSSLSEPESDSRPPTGSGTGSHKRGSPSESEPERPTPDSMSTSHQWTNVISTVSSFPDLSFPSHPHSPPGASHQAHSHPHQHHHGQHSHSHSHQQPGGKDNSGGGGERDAPKPPSATLAVFDASLSTRTRILALTSALAINFLLPFINGVMLGFGDIFARNLMGWMGWNVQVPGGSATAVGVRAANDRKKK